MNRAGRLDNTELEAMCESNTGEHKADNHYDKQGFVALSFFFFYLLKDGLVVIHVVHSHYDLRSG